MLFAQGLLGEDLLLGEQACSVPVSAQIDRLARELSAREGPAVCIYEVELEQLLGAQRDVACDALVAGEPSPFVLMGDLLVCTGSVDVQAVIEAIEQAVTAC